MKRSILLAALTAVLAFGIAAQTISFGLGDIALEARLNDIGASGKADLAAFAVEVNLQWNIPVQIINSTLAQGLLPAETYLACALANLSGKPVPVVVEIYRKNKSKGWGAVAKELGIKPGSKEFKALKDKSSASSDKAKKWKK